MFSCINLIFYEDRHKNGRLAGIYFGNSEFRIFVALWDVLAINGHVAWAFG